MRYDLYWSPEGKKIATVEAKDARAACRQAPPPYRQYLGELYATPTPPDRDLWDRYLDVAVTPSDGAVLEAIWSTRLGIAWRNLRYAAHQTREHVPEIVKRSVQQDLGADAIVRAYCALSVIATTPEIRTYLAAHDPQALAQVERALR